MNRFVFDLSPSKMVGDCPSIAPSVPWGACTACCGAAACGWPPGGPPGGPCGSWPPGGPIGCPCGLIGGCPPGGPPGGVAGGAGSVWGLCTCTSCCCWTIWSPPERFPPAEADAGPQEGLNPACPKLVLPVWSLPLPCTAVAVLAMVDA